MAGRCQARIGHRRNVQILREILGEDLALENVGQQFLVARTQNDVVMAQIGIAIPHRIAKIDHHQRHALLAKLDHRIAVDPPMRLVDQAQIGGGIIRVGDNQISLDLLAGCQRDPGREALPTHFRHIDPVNLRVQVHRAAQLLELGDEGRDQRAGAAHREMHTPGLLHEMNHRIDCGHL